MSPGAPAARRFAARPPVLRPAAGALLAVVLAAASAAAQHGGDILVGSDANGGGALRTPYEFSAPIRVTRSFAAGGTTLYSSTDPGFDAFGDTAGGIFPLKRNVEVRVQVTRIAAGASLQLGGVTLDAPGESARVGTSPALHVHPSWRLTLPDGIVGSYEIAFRLTASRAYDDSREYVATLTNHTGVVTPSAVPSDTPTATPVETVTATMSATATPPDAETPPPTPSATPTADPSTCAGDCNGDGTVTVSELVRGVNQALGAGGECAAFDTDADGAVGIAELIAAVTAALAGCGR